MCFALAELFSIDRECIGILFHPEHALYHMAIHICYWFSDDFSNIFDNLKWRLYVYLDPIFLGFVYRFDSENVHFLYVNASSDLMNINLKCLKMT